MTGQTPATSPQHTGTRRILITAGPTHEPIDEVRFIGNRSSGRVGIAIAEAAIRQGWQTTLLLGPGTQCPEDSRVRVERFRTADDLNQLLIYHFPDTHILVMAAAVADFKPADPDWTGQQKVRRRDGPVTLRLEPTSDLLAACASQKQAGQVLIGFALEPRKTLEASARDKLLRKNLDAIVANPLETMDADSIEPLLILRSGEIRSPRGTQTKPAFGTWLIEQLQDLFPPHASPTTD